MRVNVKNAGNFPCRSVAHLPFSHCSVQCPFADAGQSRKLPVGGDLAALHGLVEVFEVEGDDPLARLACCGGFTWHGTNVAPRPPKKQPCYAKNGSRR